MLPLAHVTEGLPRNKLARVRPIEVNARDHLVDVGQVGYETELVRRVRVLLLNHVSVLLELLGDGAGR